MVFVAAQSSLVLSTSETVACHGGLQEKAAATSIGKSTCVIVLASFVSCLVSKLLLLPSPLIFHLTLQALDLTAHNVFLVALLCLSLFIVALCQPQTLSALRSHWTANTHLDSSKVPHMLTLLKPSNTQHCIAARSQGIPNCKSGAVGSTHLMISSPHTSTRHHNSRRVW